MKLSDIQMITETRKPNTWDDVRDTIDPGDVDEKKIPYYTPTQLWNKANPQPGDSFKNTPKATSFVTQIAGNSYLISTSGYNYARYVKLID